MNLKAIDLNLLVALDTLLTANSVTSAAKHLGITQPAMSNALRRLRDMVGDPIFVKHGHALVPTPWAAAVRPALARALRDLESALGTGQRFDPATAEATVTIAVSDYWQFTLLPPLVERLQQEAPKIRLHVTATAESVLASDLPKGTVSVALYLAPRALSGLHCETFVTDGYACIVRRRHPLKGRHLELGDLARFRQVVVSPRGPWSERLNEALHRAGITTELALMTAHNQVALDVVSRTDCIAIVPKRIARRACQTWPLKMLTPPIPLGEFSLGLYWHESTEASPLHRWFRALMIKEARAAYLGPVPGRR